MVLYIDHIAYTNSIINRFVFYISMLISIIIVSSSFTVNAAKPNPYRIISPPNPNFILFCLTFPNNSGILVLCFCKSLLPCE